ncbi:phage holin family protein [Mycolicibacterium brumae]|uniref:Phage holin family protein n=1 Tax=Mycolicibacterium brumae TaxID=85968 RepID=A0A2G5PFW2_9MYCO|nr:phage holin family protein [Mycolicibacterium brumae]MCV7191623.1 phage holin family protein [Mycolicibacterium brumae]PIB76923.1 hypothetical protein CQY22_004625 [Mycolicibacterium brumae]RWA20523.1 hypothetical protein MBRU_02370 [Mycolicibacterium brumae DSM 44177]UWW07620.1 phage holin family protein [Mycolicibacterium brumae]
MIRLLVNFLIFLGSSAIGLLVAWLILRPELSVRPSGFITAVLILAVAQAVLAPFFAKMASRYAGAFLGGVGLLSTLAALLLATLLTGSGGLNISGVGTWIAATVIVWLATALASVALPVLLVKKKAGAQ